MQGTDLQAIKLDRRPGDGKTVRGGGDSIPANGLFRIGVETHSVHLCHDLRNKRENSESPRASQQH